MQTESAWISAAKLGDKEAISALYESHVQPLFRYIAYRVESNATAEDLTSEVFLRMVKGLPSYEDTGAPFAAWLYRIAANLITDHYRRNKRQAVPDSQVEHVALDETDPLGRVAKAVEQETLRKALVALPADYQTLLILRFMQGLPNADVAAALGKSEGAVRVMQHRALKALAEQLGEAQKARSYLRGEKL